MIEPEQRSRNLRAMLYFVLTLLAAWALLRGLTWDGGNPVKALLVGAIGGPVIVLFLVRALWSSIRRPGRVVLTPRGVAVRDHLKRRHWEWSRLGRFHGREEYEAFANLKRGADDPPDPNSFDEADVRISATDLWSSPHPLTSLADILEQWRRKFG